MSSNLPESKTFCVNPWLTLHYKMGQHMNPCCMFKYDIAAGSLDNYLVSSALLDTKQKMLSSERPVGCLSCFKQEDLGHISKRQRDNNTYEMLWAAKFKKDIKKLDSKFNEYYVRLGNHCNIKCVTCSDKFSSGWISENKKYGEKYGPLFQIKSEDPIWQHMRDNAGDIHSIEFIGGEPFMMNTDEQASLFKYFVETNHAKHITIKYNTNGTRIPTEQIEYWKQFKRIEINMSMDGIGDKFEYLRFPAKWDTFLNTINFYQQVDATIDLNFVHTLSLFNIGYVKETLEFSEQVGVPIFFNLLDQPREYNIFYAPEHVKQWIYYRIKDVSQSEIQNISSKLFDKQVFKVTPKQFFDKVDILDERRGTKVRNTFKELTECMTSTI